jgi:hypothetical protein
MTRPRFKELPALICTFKRYGRVCKTRPAGDNLESLFSQSQELEAEIKKQLAGLQHD